MPSSYDTTMRLPALCSPFNPQELAYFRALLMEQQGGILQCCQGLSNGDLRPSGEGTDHPAHPSSGSLEQDLSFNFLDRAQAELGEISRALERIDGRSYGVCDGCGQSIPAARLEASPTASSCLDCKTPSGGL